MKVELPARDEKLEDFTPELETRWPLWASLLFMFASSAILWFLIISALRAVASLFLG